MKKYSEIIFDKDFKIGFEKLKILNFDIEKDLSDILFDKDKNMEYVIIKKTKKMYENGEFITIKSGNKNTKTKLNGIIILLYQVFNKKVLKKYEEIVFEDYNKCLNYKNLKIQYINIFDKTKIWKPLLDNENDYLISNYGDIYSTKSKKFLTYSTGANFGSIRLNGKYYTIYRLIYNTFIKKINNDIIIYHIDKNKNNNFVDNLAEMSKIEYGILSAKKNNS